MAPTPPTLAYESPLLAENLGQAGGVLCIEQPAPNGATFVALHLRTFLMLGLLTTLLAALGSDVAVHGWPRSHQGLLVVPVLGWLVTASRTVVAFLRRDRPTSIEVRVGEIVLIQRFHARSRLVIPHVHRFAVKRQRLALIPTGLWQVRAHSPNAPTRSFEVRLRELPSLPLLWYRQRDDAERAAQAIEAAFRGRHSPATPQTS